jgi:prevent-host-death family protein
MAAHVKPLPDLKASKFTATKPVLLEHKPFAKRREPIAAAKAKAQFLRLLDDVERNQQSITITKRGRVVAQLVPAPPEKKISNFDRVFGSMAGTVKITGDIVSPDWESWGPEWR